MQVAEQLVFLTGSWGTGLESHERLSSAHDRTVFIV